LTILRSPLVLSKEDFDNRTQLIRLDRECERLHAEYDARTLLRRTPVFGSFIDMTNKGQCQSLWPPSTHQLVTGTFSVVHSFVIANYAPLSGGELPWIPHATHINDFCVIENDVSIQSVATVPTVVAGRSLSASPKTS